MYNLIRTKGSYRYDTLRDGVYHSVASIDCSLKELKKSASTRRALRPLTIGVICTYIKSYLYF